MKELENNIRVTISLQPDVRQLLEKFAQYGYTSMSAMVCAGVRRVAGEAAPVVSDGGMTKAEQDILIRESVAAHFGMLVQGQVEKLIESRLDLKLSFAKVDIIQETRDAVMDEVLGILRDHGVIEREDADEESPSAVEKTSPEWPV
jgi:hypothetical protein